MYEIATSNSLVVQHTIDTPYIVGPVHCYTATLQGELVLFDTGPPTPEAQAYLRSHVDLKRLRHVFVSHCHIDHYGLASWLERESRALLHLPYRDVLKIRHHHERLDLLYDYLRGAGFSTKYLEELRAVMATGVLFPPFPERYAIAEESVPELAGLNYLACPGHSQSDLVYVTNDFAVTGDTLLHNIFQSPLLDIDLETGQRFSNYTAYCQSLVRLAGLAGLQILPGHRGTIPGVADILLFYIDKLLQRARQVRPHRHETDLAGVVDRLFGESMREPFHLYLKVSEILFMQDFLNNPELLATALQKTGLYGAIEEKYSRLIAGIDHD